jgi:hypothetical protein
MSSIIGQIKSQSTPEYDAASELTIDFPSSLVAQRLKRATAHLLDDLGINMSTDEAIDLLGMTPLECDGFKQEIRLGMESLVLKMNVAEEVKILKGEQDAENAKEDKAESLRRMRWDCDNAPERFDGGD